MKIIPAYVGESSVQNSGERILDRIAMRGIRTRGRHGVYAAERAKGQVFEVDFVLQIDRGWKTELDEVSTTVDYDNLAVKVVDLVEGEPLNLIETLAEKIAMICLEEPLVVVAEVTVHKPGAPIPISVPFADVAVTVARRRQEANT